MLHYVKFLNVDNREECVNQIQPDQDGRDRHVWMFPVRPILDNDVAKPPLYVFKDMDDYKARGKNVDKEYAALLASKKGARRKNNGNGLKGKKIKHKTYGVGTIIKLQDNMLYVNFEGNDKRTFNYELCIEKGIIEFI